MSLETVANVATALGIVFAVFQLSRSRAERRHQLAQIYIQRFWEISDARLRAEKGNGDTEMEAARYLRLCEDEYEIAALRFLDSRTWHLWHRTIRQCLEGDIDSQKLLDAEPDAFQLVQACWRQRPAEHAPRQCEAREEARRRSTPSQPSRWWRAGAIASRK
jgi:hypothetical protein